MEHFYSLGPEAMLDAVESALGAGTRATGRCLALNSVENRVCDIELEATGEEIEGRHVVAKFYRPGRWSREAILEEHGFLAELAGAEVPAVAAGMATAADPVPTMGAGDVTDLGPRILDRLAK